MKTSILLFLGVLFSSYSFSQVSFDNGETYYTDSSETVLCNGKFRKFYSGYNIKSSASFKAGKLNGDFHEYFENGLTKTAAHYKLGLLDGEYAEYYPEINVMKFKTHYLMGVKHGEETTFDEVGEKIKSVFYENGVLKE